MKKVLLTAFVAALAVPLFASITVETGAVVAQVTPWGTSAWIGRVDQPGYWSWIHSTPITLLTDTDGDGVVRWTQGSVSEFSVWAMVDMTARTVHAVRADGTVLNPGPLQVNFLRPGSSCGK